MFFMALLLKDSWMQKYLLNEHVYLITGPSHAEYCSDHSCIKNSLDFSPALYAPFGTNFSYFNSFGRVHASHSGVAYRDKEFPCRVEIHRLGENGILTTYSHIRVDVANNQKVVKGDAIGFIETRRMEANCACDPVKGKRKKPRLCLSTVCPHFHVSCFDRSYRMCTWPPSALVCPRHKRETDIFR